MKFLGPERVPTPTHQVTDEQENSQETLDDLWDRYYEYKEQLADLKEFAFEKRGQYRKTYDKALRALQSARIAINKFRTSDNPKFSARVYAKLAYAKENLDLLQFS